jgi:hypothetical protein
MAAKRSEGQFLGFAVGVDDRREISRVDGFPAVALNLSQLFVLAGPRTAGPVTAQHQAADRPPGLDLVQLPNQRRVGRGATVVEQRLPFPSSGFPLDNVDVVGAIGDYGR